MVRHGTMTIGAFVNRSTEALTRFSRSFSETPFLARSFFQRFAIVLANFSFRAESLTTMNRQGCALCADGAQVAASRMVSRILSETSLDVYSRILRLFFKKPILSESMFSQGIFRVDCSYRFS